MIFRDIYAFIDWDTSRRCSWLAPVEAVKAKKGGASGQLQAIYNVLGAVAGQLFAGSTRVRPRLYHGWHRGNEPTVDRRELVGVDPGRRTVGTVLLEPPVVADALLCGPKLRDTVRRRSDGSDEQKMVDTALCADLLWLARSEASRKERVGFLVMSEDDDMVPAVMVAREWGFDCRIIRQREDIPCMPHARSLIVPHFS